MVEGGRVPYGLVINYSRFSACCLTVAFIRASFPSRSSHSKFEGSVTTGSTAASLRSKSTSSYSCVLPSPTAPLRRQRRLSCFPGDTGSPLTLAELCQYRRPPFRASFGCALPSPIGAADSECIWTACNYSGLRSASAYEPVQGHHSGASLPRRSREH